MHLHLRGSNFPLVLLDVISAITNYAKLRFSDLVFDAEKGMVRLPITRYPYKPRRVLGSTYDKQSPIRSIVTVCNVVSCDIQDNTAEKVDGEVSLLFGIAIGGNEVIASSAEESKGDVLYQVTMKITELNIEIADETD